MLNLKLSQSKLIELGNHEEIKCKRGTFNFGYKLKRFNKEEELPEDVYIPLGGLFVEYRYIKFIEDASTEKIEKAAIIVATLIQKIIEDNMISESRVIIDKYNNDIGGYHIIKALKDKNIKPVERIIDIPTGKIIYRDI